MQLQAFCRNKTLARQVWLLGSYIQNENTTLSTPPLFFLSPVNYRMDLFPWAQPTQLDVELTTLPVSIHYKLA